jgi:phenylpropionate dioxygenase-like ring-hydroxylating dioxygenase large terminal subunit
MSADKTETELYDRFYTQEFPFLGKGPVSIESYVSPGFFELERERIFKKSWLLVCHESELPNPGDYDVKEIAIWGTSVIVIRGSDGIIRAFHNVCRHRGNKIIYEDGKGHTKTLLCNMHAWNYGLDGRLKGVPEQDRFFDLDKKKCGLPPISLDTWNGFVFIHAEAKPEKTLKEYLGSLAQSMEDYPFDRMQLVSKYSSRMMVNWKVAVNAFQEGYHVATVHKVMLPNLTDGLKSRACRLANFRLHGNHRAATLLLNSNFRPSPVEALAGEFSLGLSKNMESEAGLKAWPGTNPGKVPNFGFDINVFFPMNFIDLAQGWCLTYEFWPVSVDETYYVAKLYLDKPRTWSQRIGQELTVVQMREGLLEDITTLEATQKALMSGAIDSIILSDQEMAIRHQHYVIDKIIRG